MGLINVDWGVLQVLDASISFPHKTTFALYKVVEQRRASLFLTQRTIDGVLIMLSLEALSNFAAIGQGIQVHERNESESLDKYWVKIQEVHITETSEIDRHPEDVKVNVDMVVANTSKQVSLTNFHVSKVTPQISRIANSVLLVRL